MKKKQLITFCVGLLLHSFIFAQYNDAKIDSLANSLSMDLSDTVRIRSLINLGSLLWNQELDDAELYATKALELSQRINYSYGLIKANYTLGVIHRKKGNSDLAKSFGKESLFLAEKEKNLHFIATSSNSLGTVFKYEGNYDSAAIYYFLALEHYDKAGLKSKMANAQNNLGNVFYRQKKNDLAEKYFLNALEGFRKGNNESFMAIALMNLAKVQKVDSLAMDYYYQSLDIHTKKNNISGIGSVHINIGARLIKRKEYEAALPHYETALELMTQIKNKPRMAIACSSLGKIQFILGKNDKAIEYYERSLTLSKSANFKNEQRDVYQKLAILYEDQKNYKKAYEYLKISKTIADTLYSEKNLAITSELEAKFDSKQKEAELATQQLTIEQQKNSKNKLLIGGIIFLLGMTAIFQRYYYHQKKKKQEALLAFEKQKTESESLRALDELKTNFFTNISHELKTPLSMIITPLEEALVKSSDDNLVLAHNNSKKLFSLVKEILDLSKLETGQLELNETPVLLSQLTSRIFLSFKTLANRRKIKMSQHFDFPQYTKVALDIEKFEKIISNLLSNAIKFSNDGGSIHMEINRKKTDSKTLSLKITDTGLGISKKDLKQIFNRFYQSEDGKKAGGTGIGLALSKELAHLFGGNLIANSEPNKGSVFTLEIPLKEIEHTPLTSDIIDLEEKFINNKIDTKKNQSTYQPILFNNQKARILIVEDNYEMSDFLTKILSPYYQVKTATNGKEAIQKLNNHQFDLITSDLMMPEMDGFELRSNINKTERLRQMPYIMLTASSFETDKLKGLSLGVDDYITKPFNSKELLARINNLLKNKQERDRFQKEEPEIDQSTTVDHKLLEQAEKIVMKNIHNLNFKVPDLAKEIGYSQRQLTRIIKKLTGLSPVGFILEIRLQKAYQLFQSRQFATVSEIRYEIGIESAAYFTTKFKERFGKSPKEYLVS